MHYLFAKGITTPRRSQILSPEKKSQSLNRELESLASSLAVFLASMDKVGSTMKDRPNFSGFTLQKSTKAYTGSLNAVKTLLPSEEKISKPPRPGTYLKTGNSGVARRRPSLTYECKP